MADHVGRGMGVECHARGGAQFGDVGQRAVEVRTGLGVHDHDVAAGLDIAVEKAVGFDDHQVGLESHVDMGSDRGDHVGSEREVGYEHAVHDIPLDAVDACILESDALRTQLRVVGGKDRWCDLYRSGHGGDPTPRPQPSGDGIGGAADTDRSRAGRQGPAAPVPRSSSRR